jgi:hypothetical protein
MIEFVWQEAPPRSKALAKSQSACQEHEPRRARRKTRQVCEGFETPADLASPAKPGCDL